MARRAALSAPTPVSVNVRLGPGRSHDDVVADLRTAGLSVDRVLRRVGVVCGTVAVDELPGLADVAGVTAVEPDRGVSAMRAPA